MSKGGDYFLDMAINAAIEYVQNKEGIELKGKDRLRYKSIIINDELFHVFAFFKYGLLIDYDKDTDELVVNELKGGRSGRYTKEDFAFIKYSVDRFGSLEEFKKAYRNFKVYSDTTEDDTKKTIQESNKEFRKEYSIPDRVPIPSDLDDLIDSL
jgi:hypothetical protein